MPGGVCVSRHVRLDTDWDGSPVREAEEFVRESKKIGLRDKGIKGKMILVS